MATISTAVAQRDEAAKPGAMMRQRIEAQRAEFARGLPAHIDVDRFIRGALNALHSTPKLIDCTLDSVMLGLSQAAQLGLEVNDARAQAFLIPRWDGRASCNKATLQLGWKGLVDLAARSGIIVEAGEIREHDQCDYRLGSAAHLDVRPSFGDRGKVLAYYAVGQFRDGRSSFEVMSLREVEEHRDKFASSKDKQGRIYGPWVEHFDAMARKTVIRRLLNRLPQAVEFARADAIEAEGYEAPAPVAHVPTLAALPPLDVDTETGELRSPHADNPKVVDVPDRDAGDADDRKAPEPPLAGSSPSPASPHSTARESHAGAEYGDVVEPEGDTTILGQIKRLMTARGLQDDRGTMARLFSQVLGVDVVNAGKDTSNADKLKVKRALDAIPEGEVFPLEPEPRGAVGAQDGEMMTDMQWRTEAKKRDVGLDKVLVYANSVRPDGFARFATVDEFVGTATANTVWAWLRGQK